MAKQMEQSQLHQLFVTKLKALYDVENQLAEALETMADSASDKELKAGFVQHQEETLNHVARLEEIFDLLEEKPAKLKVEAVRGMIKDTEWLIKNTDDSRALDLGLAAAAQYAEHYEIAGYTAAIDWARQMGHQEARDLLEETVNEEKMTSENLMTLTQSRLIKEADSATA
jgi:ferritin-like metal-binding protein YciE